MNATLRAVSAISMVLLGISTKASCEAGSWKIVTFPVEAGIVSSVAIERERVAVGLTSGGVAIVDTGASEPTLLADKAFGPKGRILSLAWFAGDLWIATQKGLFRYGSKASGLERDQENVPAGIRTGVRAMRTQGNALWSATLRRLARVEIAGKLQYKEWFFPVEIDPTCVLRVGGRVLVGTGSKGLYVLDTASERWVHFGLTEGLSSDHVSAMEWMGDQVLVGTSDGIDVLDLSNLTSFRLARGFSVSWMTQVNGALYASTLDSLVRIDPRTHERSSVEIPEGLQPEGDLSFADGLLAVGFEHAVGILRLPTLLGFEPIQYIAEGFGIRLPEPLPGNMKLQAQLRLPEWPAVRIPLGVSVRGDGRDVVISIPSDSKGRVQIDLMAMSENRLIELRSMEGDGDRTRPGLQLDHMDPMTNRQELTIRGVVSGPGPLTLSLLPSNQILPVSSTGMFKAKVLLQPGENRLELELVDALGRRLRRDFVVRMDDVPPRILQLSRDTVQEPVARIRIPYRDESEVKVTIVPAAGTSLSVFDSFAVLEARNLVPGWNSWRAVFVDEGGNSSSSVVRVFRALPNPQSPTPGFPSGGGSVDDSTRIGTTRSLADTSLVAVHVIRYRMEKGENIRVVAKKFYGVKEMDAILVRWNGLANAQSSIAEGSDIEIPMWKGFEYGRVDPADALQHFPWDDAPGRRRTRQ